MKLTLRSTCSSLGALAIVLLAAPAPASMSYPEDVQNKLALDEIAGPTPGCRLCHTDDEGGLKNVTKPFGRSLMLAGASGANIPSLLGALDLLESDGTDSDHDGIGDIAELKAGTDPNVGADGEPLDDVPLPQTGCSLRSAAPDTTRLATLAGVLGLLLWVSRRSARQGACSV